MTKDYCFDQILVLGIFFIVYQIAYRRKNLFQYNRVFLITSLLLSIIIPSLSFDVFPYTAQLMESEGTINHSGTINPVAKAITKSISYWSIIYWTGVTLSAIIFVLQLIRIFNFIKSNSFVKHNNTKIAYLKNSNFSFFNYIFVESEDEIIKNHELGHSYYCHSFDKILINFVAIFAWFNPFIHIYKYLLNENHECMADYFAMEKLNLSKSQYAHTLLLYITNRQNANQLTNNFSVQLKNRIKMLAKSNNQKNAYLFMLPILALIFTAFTFKKYPVYVKSADSIHTLDTLTKPEIINSAETSKGSNNKNVQPSNKTNLDDNKPQSELDNIMSELQGIKLSGKVYPVIDTSEYFDTETAKHWIMIIKYDLPIEINPFKYDFQYANAIVEKFATNKSQTRLDIPKLPSLLDEMKQIKYSGGMTTYEQEIKKVEYVDNAETGMIIKEKLIHEVPIEVLPYLEKYNLPIFINGILNTYSKNVKKSISKEKRK
jgi:BlaR1 peptidase M56